MMASTLSRASSSSPPPTKNIDELTTTLSSFSRAHTPDPHVVCCCRREDCETTKAWAGLRAQLEGRLVLSAEVGQALLERHEAYVRRQDAALSRQASSIFSFSEDDETSSLQQHVEYLTKKLDTVTEENTLMESRLNELMIKHEMADASNRTVMHELQESRATIGRLSAQTARSAGWEMRLAQVTQERDDMRQERDSQAQRARLAESKAAAFVDKCGKLHNEIYALREEVHNFRASRADFSKNVLQEARVRLESLQSLGRDRTREDPETTYVLESLVADNETLKRDIAELQNLLVEAREDVRTLREELEEYRVSAPSVIDDLTKVGTPPPSTLYKPRSPMQGRLPGHHPTNSGTSASSMLYGLPHAPNLFAPSPRTHSRNHRRSLSGDTRFLGDEVITEWRNSQDNLSPLRSHSPHNPKYSPTQLHHGDELARDASPSIKPLLLLTRSRGVQTDPQLGFAYPSPRPSTLVVDRDSAPSTPTPEGRSDTSSINMQDQPRTVGALLERVTALLARICQADVKTLTVRLKRQHLGSGDVGHVSRTTIQNILHEAAGLRAQVGGGRDDALTVTKADSKALLKFFKDAFAELGTLREQLNEVILDPAMAHRLRKEAMEPEKGKGDARPSSAMGGWIAPIQKLFTTNPTPSSASSNVEPSGGTGKSVAELGRGRPTARVVPKLAPAISATSTTVNVEFASTGVRKTDSSDASQRASASVRNPPQESGPIPLRRPIAVSHTSSSRHLMGIFAGAPQSYTKPSPTGESWVVLPKSDHNRTHQLKGVASSAVLGASARNGHVATIGRAAARNANRLSRNVDAVIDQNNEDVPDFRETLLERTLRPRGLSDSSIHTSFLKGESSPTEAHIQKQSDSSKVMETGTPFRVHPNVTVSPGTSPPTRSMLGATLDRDKRERSPVSRLGRNLASWATVASGLDDVEVFRDSDLVVGSPREDGVLHHVAWTRRGLEERHF